MKAKVNALCKFYLCAVIVGLSALASAYEVEYRVEFVPESAKARVQLLIENTASNNKRAVKEITFTNKPNLHSNFKANGKLKVTNKNISWKPPQGKAWLSLDVDLLHERDAQEYDSYINEDWALFRGDDLFPSAKVVTAKGATANTLLKFEMPKTWPYVNTGWIRNEAQGRGHKAEFIIDDPDRSFDRPTGWMIAGKIGTRRDVLGETLVSISSPQRKSFAKEGPGLKRMEVLTLLHFVWPEMQKLFEQQPSNLLVVGASDPMWRGGLSAPNSLYVHADRPLISENGTSTLLHEVFHSLTRIRGAKNDDWIAEGLAEYYSIMLVYRSGGMADERLEFLFKKLQTRSKKVKTLRKRQSSGATTAKAVLIFRELDKEIKSESKGKYSLDDVVKQLIVKREVGLEDLQEISQSLLSRKPLSLSNLK